MSGRDGKEKLIQRGLSWVYIVLMNEMSDPSGVNDFRLQPPRTLTSAELAPRVERVLLSADEVEKYSLRANKSEKSSDEGSTWVMVPGPPKADSETAWHYTDATGLMGILSSDCIWATSFSMLNDSQEFLYGLSLLRDLASLAEGSRFIHPIQKQFIAAVMSTVEAELKDNSFFVSCLSSDGDSLSQWRSYGSKGGFALGFALKDSDEWVAVVDDRDLGSHGEFRDLSTWGQVLYNPNSQKKLLTEGLAYCAYASPRSAGDDDWNSGTRDVAGVLVRLVAYCKHPSFADEKEIRLVVRGSARNSGGMKFRPMALGIAPYLRMTLAPAALTHEEVRVAAPNASPLPITHLRTGPTLLPETAIAGLRLFADAHDSASATIDSSVAPFRTM